MRPAATLRRIARRQVGVDRFAAAIAAGAGNDRCCRCRQRRPLAELASRSAATSGVLQRLPRDLQQQPLLRVHAERFARRDAEEARRRSRRRRPGIRRTAPTSVPARRDRRRTTPSTIPAIARAPRGSHRGRRRSSSQNAADCRRRRETGNRCRSRRSVRAAAALPPPAASVDPPPAAAAAWA